MHSLWHEQPLLDWWFGTAPTLQARIEQRHGLWFGKHDAQDQQAQQRFGTAVKQALRGELDPSIDSPTRWLGLLLLLDQLPRMLYRQDARAFSGDRHAQAWVTRGLALGWASSLDPLQRVFVYLVLEHQEDLAAQEASVSHFSALLAEVSTLEPAAQPAFAGFLDYAERHRAVIQRFARYPHRNALLERPSTPEELAFLRQPGSSF
ncbi:DUF924 family protein [Atopomonas sediminilitoris]|uniref:DUF924 family protein n=1 Tax=Atopomonas sediminilitoris TaxID=2919919 RepID=UPI001F4EBA25|nr:DUF924 family protein [Atopomonas sediminilitoris]MCJ8169582.1 DUF924 domain-containing protein [Atopomonas sediminilitoris]